MADICAGFCAESLLLAAKGNELPSIESIAIHEVPGMSRLFLDHAAGAAQFFCPVQELQQPAVPAHRAELTALLTEQNPSASAASALAALGQGAGVVVTGQQVGLFGGPLYTPLKAATAIARARQATANGQPHVAIFWLATEDHDFAEIDHVVFPGKRQLHKLRYAHAPSNPVPVGGVLLDESITPLVDEAMELLGYSEAMTALAEAYRPRRTFSQAFADFYSRAFAAQGLLVIDAGSRAFHRLGAPVLQAALERADELHAALLERNAALIAAGYHAQVAVGSQSSLLFLIEEKTGTRLALKRTPATTDEPGGIWQAGRQSYSTGELLAILAAEPERISPSALLRPVFQDFLLGTSATVGGPAEIAYFAQSAVLFERILGRVTPGLARFSATLIEPAIGELLRKHELSLQRVWQEDAASLSKLLAARAMPVEGKKLLSAAGNALDAELDPLLAWMSAADAGLGQSGARAASKMRYQMNRLRNLAANFQLQKEAAQGRHAEAIRQALAPGGVLQERVHGAAYYFARYGFELAEELTVQAGHSTAGHSAIWL